MKITRRNHIELAVLHRTTVTADFNANDSRALKVDVADHVQHNHQRQAAHEPPNADVAKVVGRELGDEIDDADDVDDRKADREIDEDHEKWREQDREKAAKDKRETSQKPNRHKCAQKKEKEDAQVDKHPNRKIADGKTAFRNRVSNQPEKEQKP
jgi:hypothetical protein